MANPREVFRFIGRSGRRVGITIAGGTVLLLGIVLSVPTIPGPGFLLIVAGLAILGTEYAWARRALDGVKKRAKTIADKVRRRRPAADSEDDPGPT